MARAIRWIRRYSTAEGRTVLLQLKVSYRTVVYCTVRSTRYCTVATYSGRGVFQHARSYFAFTLASDSTVVLVRRRTTQTAVQAMLYSALSRGTPCRSALSRAPTYEVCCAVGFDRGSDDETWNRCSTPPAQAIRSQVSRNQVFRGLQSTSPPH